MVAVVVEAEVVVALVEQRGALISSVFSEELEVEAPLVDKVAYSAYLAFV